MLRRAAAVLGVALLSAACATATRAPGPADTARQPASTGRPLEAGQAQRLQRLMVPLVRAMNTPRQLSDVRVGVIDDDAINAANAGGSQFYVTTGLLRKANDEHLLAVLAHEVAHEDLGHVAKAQTLSTGLNLGVIILDQLIPGSGAITPLAGTLIARGYSRSEEYAADRHGVELLRRIGQPRPTETMIGTLAWLRSTSGTEGVGGFFSTHPGTGDRIEALRERRP